MQTCFTPFTACSLIPSGPDSRCPGGLEEGKAHTAAGARTFECDGELPEVGSGGASNFSSNTYPKGGALFAKHSLLSACGTLQGEERISVRRKKEV